jgi:3-phenylpropionate/cinnamic acid dioxygenase small subunit
VNDVDAMQQLIDEAAIRNLIARMAHLADAGDLETEYLELFTDDATWERPGFPAVKGHAEILAAAQERRRTKMQGPGTNTRHINTTLAVQVDGSDEASAQSYWLFMGKTDTSAPVVTGCGRYVDTFRRTGGGWKMSSRQILNT